MKQTLLTGNNLDNISSPAVPNQGRSIERKQNNSQGGRAHLMQTSPNKKGGQIPESYLGSLSRDGSETPFESVFDVVRRIQHGSGANNAGAAGANITSSQPFSGSHGLGSNQQLSSQDEQSLHFNWKKITNERMARLNATVIQSMLIDGGCVGQSKLAGGDDSSGQQIKSAETCGIAQGNKIIQRESFGNFKSGFLCELRPVNQQDLKQKQNVQTEEDVSAEQFLHNISANQSSNLRKQISNSIGGVGSTSGGLSQKTYLVVDATHGTNQLIKMEAKRYYLFRKGKLYKFKKENPQGDWIADKVLDLKNRLIDLVTLQRWNESGNHQQSPNSFGMVSRPLVQALQIRSLGQTFYFTAAPTSGGALGHLIGSGCAGMSLSGADGILSGSANIELMSARKKDEILEWLEEARAFSINLNLKTQYQIGGLLGKGNFASVYHATHYNTGKNYAIKTIDKKMLLSAKRNLVALYNEVCLVRKIKDFSNVIQMHEVFESENNIHLVLELVQGGELFERIKENGTYEEIEAARIMKALFKGLQAFHLKGIVHRDLKPENILFKDESFESLKIVDFGLSAQVQKNQLLFMKCGSPGYVAPEILSDIGYGCKADVFSAGVILYILLTGKFIFSGRNYKEILQKNRACEVPYPPQYWNQRSTEVKDFMTRILAKNPEDRFSSTQALMHPWFKILDEDIGPGGLLASQPRQASVKFSFEDVNVTSEDDDFESEINQNNLNHAIIATPRQLQTNFAQDQLRNAEDQSPMWNLKRNRNKTEKQEDMMLQTFNTPLPNPRLNIVRSLKEHSNGQSANGSQDVVLSGGIVIKNIHGHQLGANQSKECAFDDLGSGKGFNMDFSSLVQKQFTPLLRASDKTNRGISQGTPSAGGTLTQQNVQITFQQLEGNKNMFQVPQVPPIKNSNTTQNPSTFFQQAQNNSKDLKQIQQRLLQTTFNNQNKKDKQDANYKAKNSNIEESKEINIDKNKNPFQVQSNSPKFSSEGSDSQRALSNQIQPQSNFGNQFMAFNNTTQNGFLGLTKGQGAESQPVIYGKSISHDCVSHRNFNGNSMHGIQQTYKVNGSNNAQYGGPDESPSSGSSEGSINDEEIADEIADEDDNNSKSAGYSSGLSIFQMQKQISSNNNQLSQGLINLKGLSQNLGGPHSEGNNQTQLIDMKLNFTQNTIMKQSLTSINNQLPLSYHEGQDTRNIQQFSKIIGHMPSQPIQQQTQIIKDKLRKNVTETAGPLTISNEINLDSNQQSVGLKNKNQIKALFNKNTNLDIIVNDDSDANGGIMSKMQKLVPTTPGSVFGGSRNVMRQSHQHLILETYGEDDDNSSYKPNGNSNINEPSQKSGKSGDSLANQQSFSNNRGSFGIESMVSSSGVGAGAYATQSQINQKIDRFGKLKLYDDKQRAASMIHNNYDLQDISHDTDQVKTKKILPFRKISKEKVVLPDTCSLVIDAEFGSQYQISEKNGQLQAKQRQEISKSQQSSNNAPHSVSILGQDCHNLGTSSSSADKPSTINYANIQGGINIPINAIPLSQNNSETTNYKSKITSLFANRTPSKFYHNKETTTSTQLLNRGKTGEDGTTQGPSGSEELISDLQCSGLVFNQSQFANNVLNGSSYANNNLQGQALIAQGGHKLNGTIAEDMEEDKYEYTESEIAPLKARNKKKLLPTLVQSSEGSGSNGTYNPEAQKPKEPEDVPSHHDDGVKSHSFHTANQSFHESSSGGFQSMKRIVNRQECSSDHQPLGPDHTGKFGSRPGSHYTGAAGPGQPLVSCGVSGTHQQLSSNAGGGGALHGDIELDQIDINPNFKKNVQTFAEANQTPQLSMDNIIVDGDHIHMRSKLGNRQRKAHNNQI